MYVAGVPCIAARFRHHLLLRNWGHALRLRNWRHFVCLICLFLRRRELGVATLCVIWDILCAQAVSFYAVVGCIVSLLRNRGHKAPFICLFYADGI